MPDMHVVPGIWTVTIGYERMLAWFREIVRRRRGRIRSIRNAS